VAKHHGASAQLAIALIGPFSSLCGCTTNYSTGSFLIFFAMDKVPMRQWFAVGAAVGVFHLVIWIGIGLPYWKALGLY
jgi:DASS family divalent anion:Na+ symporter